MATVSITNLLTGSSSPLLASGDVVPFVDVSDTTQSAQGSTVKATLTQFFAAIPVPIIVTNTGTQLQLKYDGSNHVTVAVSSAGAVTLNATGASAGFTFSDPVTVSGTTTLGGAASPVLVGRLSDATTFGAISLNGVLTNAGLLGLVGISGGNLQFRAPTGGAFTFTVNAADVASVSTTGGITATTGTFTGTLGTATTQKVALNAGATSFLTESATNQVDIQVDGGVRLRMGTTDVNSSGNLSCTNQLYTGIGVSWDFGAADTVSPTSPNRTLRVDVNGTTYYIAAKTTND